MIIQPGGAEKLGFFVPLHKIDEEKQLVYGRAAQEVPDRSCEIMDYASAKPAFQAWSDSFVSASNGLSKGNIRVMHQRDKAAGKVVEINYNDDEKAIDICAKIVDPVEWKKCVEGVYTGFSMGGGYACPKWDDPVHKGYKRYTPKISEMSLVDLPCIPTANFAELVKIGGAIEQLRLVGRPRTFAEIWTPAPRSFAEIWKGA
jgi:hypothetical protein